MMSSVTLRAKRLAEPFLALLRQGVTPQKIALTIALGTLLGVIPVLGSTILLCTFASLRLGLNLPAIQLVNALVYPLQLALLIPFYKLGAWMFGAAAPAFSLGYVFALIQSGVLEAMSTLWTVTLHALAAWLLFGGITCLALYAALIPVIAYFWRTAQK